MNRSCWTALTRHFGPPCQLSEAFMLEYADNAVVFGEFSTLGVDFLQADF
jgi:hypothetical protein